MKKMLWLVLVVTVMIGAVGCGQKFTKVESIPNNQAVVYIYNATETSMIKPSLESWFFTNESEFETIKKGGNMFEIMGIMEKGVTKISAKQYYPFIVTQGNLKLLFMFEMVGNYGNTYKFLEFQTNIEPNKEYFIKIGHLPTGQTITDLFGHVIELDYFQVIPLDTDTGLKEISNYTLAPVKKQ